MFFAKFTGKHQYLSFLEDEKIYTNSQQKPCDGVSFLIKFKTEKFIKSHKKKVMLKSHF